MSTIPNAYVGAYTAQCEGKRPFESKALAKLVIRRHRGCGGVMGLLSAYRCPHCGDFHIGKRGRKR